MRDYWIDEKREAKIPKANEKRDSKDLKDEREKDEREKGDRPNERKKGKTYFENDKMSLIGKNKTKVN